jgi:hypothetical protein
LLDVFAAEGRRRDDEEFMAHGATPVTANGGCCDVIFGLVLDVMPMAQGATPVTVNGGWDEDCPDRIGGGGIPDDEDGTFCDRLADVVVGGLQLPMALDNLVKSVPPLSLPLLVFSSLSVFVPRPYKADPP